MSVPTYKRKQSKFQVYEDAYNFVIETYKFCMNEKRMPKRWRPVLVYPMIQLMNGLIGSIVRANTIYPVCGHEAYQRRTAQTNALVYIQWISYQFRLMMDLIPTNKDPYQPLFERLLKVRDLMQKWRKADMARYRKQFPDFLPTVENDYKDAMNLQEKLSTWTFTETDSAPQLLVGESHEFR